MFNVNLHICVIFQAFVGQKIGTQEGVMKHKSYNIVQHHLEVVQHYSLRQELFTLWCATRIYIFLWRIITYRRIYSSFDCIFTVLQHLRNTIYRICTIQLYDYIQLGTTPIKNYFKRALPVWGGRGGWPLPVCFGPFLILGVKVLKRPYNGYISTWKSWCRFFLVIFNIWCLPLELQPPLHPDPPTPKPSKYLWEQCWIHLHCWPFKRSVIRRLSPLFSHRGCVVVPATRWMAWLLHDVFQTQHSWALNLWDCQLVAALWNQL